jgi:hypothetical protein
LLFLSNIFHLISDNKLSPNPPLVDQVVDLTSSLVDPNTPLKSETKVVDPTSSSVDPTLPLKSETDIAHVFLVDIDSPVLGGISPTPMEPPPSNQVIIFNWNVLTGPHLPSYIPFQIIVQVCGRDIPQTIVDEGASISILSSIAWKDLGSPPLAPVTQNLLDFNRRDSQPLGILPQFPITLGGKTILY